jgi:hypothetical protein
MLLLPFQIIRYFGFSRYVAFAMSTIVYRKTKTSYSLKQMEYKAGKMQGVGAVSDQESQP